jgi:NDP-sugar pyrophosphorylase family protein
MAILRNQNTRDASWLVARAEKIHQLIAQLGASASGGIHTRIHGNLNFNENSKYANGGVYWINPRAFTPFIDSIGTNYSLENEVIPIARKMGQLFMGIKFSGTFIDIGLPDDYHRAQSMSCFT